MTLELPQNSQKPLFKCKKLVINTIKCVVRWSEKSVRFEKSYGIWLSVGPNSVRDSVRYGSYAWEWIFFENFNVIILSFRIDRSGQCVDPYHTSTRFAIPSASFRCIITCIWKIQISQILGWLQQIFRVSEFLGILLCSMQDLVGKQKDGARFWCKTLQDWTLIVNETILENKS